MLPGEVEFLGETTLLSELVVNWVLEWFVEVKSNQKKKNREMYGECNASDIRKVFWFVVRICQWNVQE